jgi:hypothetical protein
MKKIVRFYYQLREILFILGTEWSFRLKDTKKPQKDWAWVVNGEWWVGGREQGAGVQG